MVLTNLGVLCKREGNLDDAVAAYDRALSADPKNRAALYNRAWARRQTGDLRGAAADGRILVELFPQEAGAHFELGAALLVLGKEREALREYDRALELDPDHLDSLLDRSMVRRSMGNLDGAIADSTRRLELKPDDSYAHNNRGNAYLDQGNLDAARRDLEAAVALDPGNDKARKNLEILGRKMAAAQPPAPRPTATAAPPKAPPTAAPPPQTAGMIEGATDAVPAAFISLDPARMEPGGGPSADELWTPVAQALPKAAAPSVVSPMPRPLDPGNIDLVDYQAAVVSAVEAMRQIYGPMSPAAEVRFGAKWAPMFDNPFPEAVAYLNRLNPLLSQFLATRAAITEVALDLEAALGEASYAEGFGDPDGLETAMALALIHHDQLQALAARLRLIVEDVLALGEPPDPVADKARRRKRFLDTLAATRDLLPAGGPDAGAAPGQFVLADTWSQVAVDQSTPHFRNSVTAQGTTIRSSSEFVPFQGGQKPYTKAYSYSWSGVPQRHAAGEEFTLSLRAEDGGCTGTNYYSTSLYLSLLSASGTPEEVAHAISELKANGPRAYEAYTPLWYPRKLGSAGFQVDTRDGAGQMWGESAATDSFTGPGATDAPQYASGAMVRAYALEFSALTDAGVGRVYYVYLWDPTGASVREVDLETAGSHTVTAETPESILRRQYHDANVAYFSDRVADLQRQLGTAGDQSQRDFLRWQILAAEANLQGERDAITSLDTGQWVRTRTGFDNLCAYQAAHRSAVEDARWTAVRRKINGAYRMLRLAPIDQRDDLRKFLERQFDPELIASGDPAKVGEVVEAVTNRIQGHWEGESATEEAKAWEQEENIFWAQSIKMGATILLTGDVSKAAISFGATLAQAQWAANAAGALYGGVTGYVEGGPGAALKESIASTGIVAMAATEAVQGYRDATARGSEWKDAFKEGAARGGTILVLGKGLEFGAQGLARWFAGKPPTVQEAFEQARFRQQLDWDRSLVDHFQRKQWELAQAVSQGAPMSAVQALNQEIRGLTGSINGSYGAKWLLKNQANAISQAAFVGSVEEIYEDVMPTFRRNLEAMGYDLTGVEFNPIRNASSAGSPGMDWDVALSEASERGTILRNGQPVGLATLQDDAQRAMNRSYFDVTGISARQTDIAVTTSIHPEAYWDRRWLDRVVDYEGLDPTRIDQARWVTRHKAVEVMHKDHMNSIQKTQEICRGTAKDLDTKLLKYLDHKITAAGAVPGNAQQVKRLQELKAHWVEVRDGMSRIGTQETDPEVIRREMENLKQLTGGQDAFDIVENMNDLWQALDKWVAR